MLPLLVGEAVGHGLDVGLVVGTGEVGTVRTATLVELGGRTGEDALAPPAEDARPVAREEGDVEDPGAVAAWVVERHPLVKIGGD